jgi:hypothetical protein
LGGLLHLLKRQLRPFGQITPPKARNLILLLIKRRCLGGE